MVCSCCVRCWRWSRSCVWWCSQTKAASRQPLTLCGRALGTICRSRRMRATSSLRFCVIQTSPDHWGDREGAPKPRSSEMGVGAARARWMWRQPQQSCAAFRPVSSRATAKFAEVATTSMIDRGSGVAGGVHDVGESSTDGAERAARQRS